MRRSVTNTIRGFKKEECHEKEKDYEIQAGNRNTNDSPNSLSNNKDKETFHFVYDLFQQALSEYSPKCPWEIKNKIRDLYTTLRYASLPLEKRNNIYLEVEKMKFPEDVNDELLRKYLQ